MNQILNDHFESLDNLIVFKYNAMSFEFLQDFLTKFHEDIIIKSEEMKEMQKKRSPLKQIQEPNQKIKIEFKMMDDVSYITQ